MKKKQKQIRLSRDEKADILLVVRDAVFQEIADAEEYITSEAYDETWRILERRHERDEKDFQPAIQRELNATFARIYEAVKKGEDS